MKPVGDLKIEIQNSELKKPSPIVWTIAGSDSGGGAGIQVDLKVMNAFGVHGCSVITALTAQNTNGVQSSESVSGSMLRAQLDSLVSDLPPAVIKTGMLGSLANVQVLSDFLSRLPTPCPRLVCDPVLRSTSGADLLEPDALEILRHNLFPHVTVLTPNLPETRRLLDRASVSIEDAAHCLLETGVQSVLIKGGHTDGDVCRDYWTDGSQSLWLSSPRIDTRATHGTGCILSSAIAAAVALGLPLSEAIITAKTYLNQSLRSPAQVGHGHGPMRIEPFLNSVKDRPTLQ